MPEAYREQSDRELVLSEVHLRERVAELEAALDQFLTAYCANSYALSQDAMREAKQVLAKGKDAK